MKKYITAVYQFVDDEDMTPTLDKLKNDFQNDKICGLSMGDEMTKLDQIRELIEEHGDCAIDSVKDIIYA